VIQFGSPAHLRSLREIERSWPKHPGLSAQRRRINRILQKRRLERLKRRRARHGRIR